MKKHRINEQIRSPEVRLIDQEGVNQGVVKIEEARKMAQEAGLDLVSVSGGVEPPVCKIIDYSKYLFEQKSKLKQAKTKKSELKELTFGPNIGEGDLKQRIERGKGFLQEGHMVKYTVKFRGRARAHPEFGEIKLKIIDSELAGIGKIERGPEMRGSFLSVTYVPVKKG